VSNDAASHEFLVLSRGQWDTDKSNAEIQRAIDDFYAWYERLVAEGTVRRGHRLAREGKTISKHRIADGPFAEAKEVIGGYWTIVAGSLDEAAAIAACNPCIACGLTFEVRPIETRRASAYEPGNETPGVNAA